MSKEPTHPHSPEHTPQPLEVLTYWLGDALASDWPEENRSELWFGGGAEQDRLITERFGGLVEQALAGGLVEWESGLPSRLALIILLDQFTRNVYRGQAQAFAGDARAQQLVLHTLAQGEDRQLPRVARVFLYMPLMHAEHLALQEACVAHFSELAENAPPGLRQTLAGNLRFAQEHRDIVAAHGRFPYRNAALGRENTPEEVVFLKMDPVSANKSAQRGKNGRSHGRSISGCSFNCHTSVMNGLYNRGISTSV